MRLDDFASQCPKGHSVPDYLPRCPECARLEKKERENAVMVYVVQPEAVYRHSIVAVASTREKAEERAAEWWKQSDGHHGLVIDEIPLDVFELGVLERGYMTRMGRRVITDRPPAIEFNPWEWKST